MKAPDKIYLEGCYPDNGVLPIGLHYSPSQSDIQYIRKDALLGWAKKQFNLARKCMVEAERDWNRAYENGEMMAYDNIIKKLNSM